MTPQEAMKTKLANTGIPHKEIQVYGSQIMVTTWSQDAAEKWAAVIQRFAKIRRIWESLDENKDQSEGTSLLHKYHKVWRVAAAV